MYLHLPETIVFTRHPQCLHNTNRSEARKRGISNKESPLTEVGLRQSVRTAKYLECRFGIFDAAYCSEYSRTHAIPNALNPLCGVEVYKELNERDMGVWNTLSRSEVLVQYPDEEKRFRNKGYYNYTPSGGNSCVDVERWLRTFLEMVRSKSLTRIYISGHGISGLCLHKVLTNGSVEDWNRRFNGGMRLKNASVCVYTRHKGTYICTLYNYVP